MLSLERILRGVEKDSSGLEENSGSETLPSVVGGSSC